MLKLFWIIIYIYLTSSTYAGELPGYRFTNFDNTPVRELAKAVKDNDGVRVKSLINLKSDIDFKDDKYKMTLLLLAIANKKDKAFLALLEGGANPNSVCGNKGDIVPLLAAIDFQDNCNGFYIKNLLDQGAKADFGVVYQENGYSKKKVPIFEAIDANDNGGNECVEITKLLISYGANLDECVSDSPSNNCTGIIERCLKSRYIQNLKYLIIVKKVPLPDTMYFSNIINPQTGRTFTFEEVLNDDDEYENKDTSEMKKAKQDILQYLKLVKKP